MKLYHCTDEALKNIILEKGLKIDKSQVYDFIFLGASPEYCYGNTCFIVDIDGIKVEKTINMWEYICCEDISPSRIKYYGFKEID